MKQFYSFQKYILIFSALCCLSLITSNRTIAKDILVNGSQPGMEINVLKSDAASTVIEYIFTGYNQNEISIAGMTHLLLSAPDLTLTMEKGFPQLPIARNSIIIPDYDGVNFKIIDEDFITERTMPIAPSKGHFTRDIDPDSISYTFDEFYGRDEWYPHNTIELSDPYIVRDFRGITVQFNPIKYNPVRGELFIYKRLVVEIYTEYSANPINPFNRTSNETAKEFNQIYESHFLNFAQRSADYTPLAETGRLLIIYHQNYASKVTEFIDWKVSNGFSTLSAEYPTATGTGSAAIKTYIQNLYNQPQKLMFIILVGESGEIPTLNGVYESAASDPCYVKLAGTDAYPDAYISRISPSSVNNCEYIFNKIITYETAAANRFPEDTWLFSAAGVASDESGSTSMTDWQRMNLVRDMLMDDMNFTTVDQIYDPGATSAMVTSAINSGRSVVNYIGHGSGTSWSTTGFNVSAIHDLSNGYMNPFIIDVACQNGKFTLTECMEEAWIRAGDMDNPKGAIAVYGASTNASWVPPCDMQNHAIELMTTYQKLTVGGICFNGLMHAMDLHGGSSGEGLKLMEQYNIFGDCSTMLIFTTPPDAIPPTQVTDLHTGDVTSNSITLNWTAPLDESAGGVAGYDIRYSTTPINNDTDFNAAQQMFLSGQNDVQGTPKSLSCGQLDFETIYYFALKAFDAFGNTSVMSNTATDTTWAAPDMEVNPDEVNIALPVNTTYTDSIVISNTTDAPSTLDYTVELANNTFPAEMLRINLKPVSSEISTDNIMKGNEAISRGQSIRGAGGPDTFGYEWIDSNDPQGPDYVWNDIAATGTEATNWIANSSYSAKDEGYSGPYSLGFNFKFYGVTQDKIYISSNGVITFAPITSGNMSNGSIPSSSAPNNFIAPFWDDLDGSSQGHVYYKQNGNKFIIQFDNWQKYGATSSLTFQVEINASGKIMIYYKSLSGTLTSATVGIENTDGTDGLQIVKDAAYLANNLAVSISADPEWLLADIPEGTLYNGNSAAIELQFMTAELAEGDYSMDVIITSNDPAKSTITVPVSMTVGVLNVACEIDAGWNLLSVPLQCTCMLTDSLYPNAASEAFMYNGTYVAIDTLNNGTGYWLKFDNTETINHFGASVNSEVDVREGWNIIGPFHRSIPAISINTDPEKIIVSDFFGFNGAYVSADTLQSGKGYWVKTSSAGRLMISNALNKKPSSPQIAESERIPTTLCADIEAADGISKSKINLYAGINPSATDGIDTDLNESPLPPVPPAGFDARLTCRNSGDAFSSFRDYRKFEEGTPAEHSYILRYRLTEGSDGLTLNFSIPPGMTMNISDMAGGSLINKNFKPGEGTFTDPLTAALNELQITLKYDGSIFNDESAFNKLIPDEFVLGQNYPNPFNPSTVINYALPSESNVKLEVFNMLGQKVMTLLDDTKSAGYYEIKFNGENLSSGIYFYIMTAESLKDNNSFKTVKKMILIK